MMSVEELAKRAYEAHFQALRRTPGLPWERLDIGNRAAWIATVQAVRRAIEEA